MNKTTSDVTVGNRGFFPDRHVKKTEPKLSGKAEKHSLETRIVKERDFQGTVTIPCIGKLEVKIRTITQRPFLTPRRKEKRR